MLVLFVDKIKNIVLICFSIITHNSTILSLKKEFVVAFSKPPVTLKLQGAAWLSRVQHG
jgi:hypothetical protein